MVSRFGSPPAAGTVKRPGVVPPRLTTITSLAVHAPNAPPDVGNRSHRAAGERRSLELTQLREANPRTVVRHDRPDSELRSRHGPRLVLAERANEELHQSILQRGENDARSVRRDGDLGLRGIELNGRVHLHREVRGQRRHNYFPPGVRPHADGDRRHCPRNDDVSAALGLRRAAHARCRRCARGDEGLGKLGAGGESVGGQLLQRALNRGVHVLRHGAAEHGDRADLFRHQLGDDRLRGVADVRRLAGEHFIKHGGERIDVGASVDHAIAGRLLGRHVLRRAERQSGLGDPPAAGIRDGQRDAEVGDDRLPVLEQDVLGLEVAVDDAVTVGVVERIGDGHRDANGVVDRKLLLALQPVPQRLALDVRHDVEQQPLGFARIEQRKEVRMLKVGRDAESRSENARRRAPRRAPGSAP